MATIHTYKQAKINNIGMWIQSVDGGPEIYLDARQSMALAEQINKQQRSARSAVPARRSAPTTQRSTTPTVRRSTTSLNFTGKSSYTDERYAGHAKSLAKQRAMKQYQDYAKSLARSGKAAPRGSGKYTTDPKGNVSYTITL